MLTPRQLEVLRALRAHGDAKQAARALGLRVRTVQTHLTNIYNRLGVRGYVPVLCLVCRAGLLDPPGIGRA